MALVTVTTTGVPRVLKYAIAGGVVEPHTIFPRATVEFAGSAIFATKDAADTNLWRYTAQLPLNYAYKLCETWVWAEGADSPTMEDLDDSIYAEVEDDGGQTRCTMFNATYAATAGYYTISPIPDGSGGVDLGESWTHFTPYVMPTRFFECSDTGNYKMLIADSSADSSAVVNFYYYQRFLQYDIEQINNAFIHTAIPTVPG